MALAGNKSVNAALILLYARHPLHPLRFNVLAKIQSLLSEDELQHLSEVTLRQQQQHQHQRQRQQQNQGGTSPSAAQQQQQQPLPLHPPLDGCWLPPRFKRVVWVVVDALRYDFATFSPPDDAGGREAESKLHHAAGQDQLICLLGLFAARACVIGKLSHLADRQNATELPFTDAG